MHLLRLRRDQDNVQRRMKDDVFDVFVDRQTAVLADEPRFVLPGGIGHLRSSKLHGRADDEGSGDRRQAVPRQLTRETRPSDRQNDARGSGDGDGRFVYSVRSGRKDF